MKKKKTSRMLGNFLKNYMAPGSEFMLLFLLRVVICTRKQLQRVISLTAISTVTSKKQ